jgi:Domain of unknown function (DUF4192)
MSSLRSVDDMLAVVPYLLGFHPTDSAVVLGVRDHRIVFQVRGDLPARARVGRVVGYYADVVARQRPDGAVVLGYGDGSAATPMVLGLAAALQARGIAVLDAVRVADGRYWSYLCTDSTCCPPEGRPYDVETHPLAVEAILDGCVALPSRDDLERRLAPVFGPAMVEATRRATTRLGDLLEVRPRQLRRALLRAGSAAVDAALRCQRGDGRLTDDEVAWLAVVLLHLAVRDYAWESVGGDLGVHVALWTEVVRRCDPDLVTAPATLLAFAAWRAGEGALASIALGRALAADPGYAMAQLMSRALEGGLSPADWEAAAKA